MHKEICSIPKEIVAHQAVTSHNASGFSLQMPLIGRKQSRSSRKELPCLPAFKEGNMEFFLTHCWRRFRFDCKGRDCNNLTAHCMCALLVEMF
jgi:hypothetical protein